MNKLYEFCTPSTLDINLSKIKIMIFSCDKRKVNQEASYLGKDQLEITHEYEYLGIGLYSHGNLEHRVKCDKL